MRFKLALLAGVVAMCAGAAHAQQTQPAPVAASLSNPTGASSDNRASLNVAAPGRPAATAFGRFSSEAAAGVLARVCASGQGVAGLAASFNLPSVEVPQSIRWAVPADTRVWRVESTDSTVYLYAYGSGPEHCGALVARPLAGATAANFRTAMTQPSGGGYVVETEQARDNGGQFVRFRSAQGRFVDLQEYGATEEAPGLLKIELLPR
jgi:hypothetical protein